MNTEKIIQILYKRLAGTPLNAGECDILDRWIAENPESRRHMVEQLSDPHRLAEGYRVRSMLDTATPQAEMERRLGITTPTDMAAEESACQVDIPAPRRSRIGIWLAITSVAAAAICGIIWLRSTPSAGTPASQAVATAEAPAPLRLENLSPGGTQAIVTTPTGDTLHLSSQAETIDRLARNAAATEGPLQIDVPRGGEFVVTLEDSTRVWLNSESRLIYPTHFAADRRVVELSGEAYFDVTRNPDAPFIVESAGQRVKVYGTEFNIRCYPEDPLIYTTLSSGSISLTPLGGGGELFLSPGKQALFDKATSQATVRPIDIERVTGWRHGRFVFEEQSLSQIMRDLSRWYDFEYEFADAEAAETIFMGSIPRYSNFKTAIAILEKSGGLAFNVRDNKVVISRR